MPHKSLLWTYLSDDYVTCCIIKKELGSVFGLHDIWSCPNTGEEMCSTVHWRGILGQKGQSSAEVGMNEKLLKNIKKGRRHISTLSSLRLLSQKIHRDCNCTIAKLVDQKRGRGMWSGVISLTRVAVAARRLTPFRSSTAPSISRKRVSRTTREPLRPSKSAAARPLYELHVKPSMKTRPAVRQLAQSWQQFIHKCSTPPSDLGARRYIHHTMQRGAKIQPAKRVAGRRQDVWYVADPVPFLVRTTCSFPDTSPLLRRSIHIWSTYTRLVEGNHPLCLAARLLDSY
jgi:hypothetical protein